MPELRNIKASHIDEKCSKCGQGWMRPNGVVLTSNPPQYEHSCTKCDHKQTYGVRYPYIVG